jgi:hypothetical protein
MNGCAYKLPTFTCPASNSATDFSWDLAFLSADRFTAKYDISSKMYKRLAAGETLAEVQASYRQV